MFRKLLILAAVSVLALSLASTASSETALPPSTGSLLIAQTLKPDLVVSLTNGTFTVTNVRCGWLTTGCYGGAGQQSSGAFGVDVRSFWAGSCALWSPFTGRCVWSYQSVYDTEHFDIWSLAPGASASFAFEPYGGAGCVDFVAQADPDLRVDESNEQNNHSDVLYC